MPGDDGDQPDDILDRGGASGQGLDDLVGAAGVSDGLVADGGGLRNLAPDLADAGR